MIKFGVILKILYHRYENAISIAFTLKGDGNPDDNYVLYERS